MVVLRPIKSQAYQYTFNDQDCLDYARSLLSLASKPLGEEIKRQRLHNQERDTFKYYQLGESRAFSIKANAAPRRVATPNEIKYVFKRVQTEPIPLEPIVPEYTLERVQIDLADMRHKPDRQYY